MKISQLIKKLQSFKEKYGDKGVYTWSGDDSKFLTIKKVEKEILEENTQSLTTFICPGILQKISLILLNW